MFRVIAFLVMNGLTLGALLFLMASGITLAFGLMRMVNLAHGAFYLVGGYIGISVFKLTGNWLLTALVSGLTIAIIGFFEERYLVNWVRGRELSEVLLTLGLAMIMGDIALATWGGIPQSIPIPQRFNPRVELGVITYPGFRIFVLFFGVGIGLSVWALLKKTKLGMAVRAGVDDRETTAALGINVKRVITLVFMLSAFLAGIAGVVGTSFLSIEPGTDHHILTLSLVVMIIGGMGSLGGAAIAALITGMVLSFGAAYFPEFSLFLTFAPMALILAIRPQGLFGRAV
jgi:branched-chain amino acid transport system permease protein